jgi:ADP-ribose pyrophosphatase YjhB (NUDIX family)
VKQRVLGWLYRLWGWLPIPFALRWPILWLGTHKFLVGVAAVVLNERGEVLLFRHTYRGKLPWGLPGGWLKRREDPARAVEREIREEAGLEVRVLGPVWASTEKHAQVDVVYCARLLGGVFRPSPEVSEAAFFPLDRLPAMAGGARDIPAMVRLTQALTADPEEKWTRINAEKRR